MRTDTATFAASNTALAKRPRYVIELAFDSDNATLWYFTSHTDSALPPGASSILAVIEGLSGTSQTLNPDTANATIGNINFSVVDRGSIVTTTLGGQLDIGRSTRRQRVRVYVGFEGLVWADYTLVQTQLVTEIAYSEGAYKFSCADIQREMRKDIFELAKTTLSQSLSEDGTTVEVISTSDFESVVHGTSYSDAPSATVYYFKIQEEVIRATGKTSTSFTGCTRGALNTRRIAHAVDASTVADRRTAVEEYVYLELPAVDLMYRLLTGKDRLGNVVMPTAWNLGIDTSYVRLADFTGIGSDIWDTTDDEEGFIVRFEGLTKTDGKKFIESELAILAGVFMPVYADGALGLKRMSNMLAGAAYVKMLDLSNLISVGDLIHDFDSLHNVLQINWNWEPQGGADGKGAFTRVNLLIDADSVTTHGRADPLKLKFRGLHGSRHSSTILAQRFDSLRDRYSGPPERTQVKVLPSLNNLEVGDVVRHRPAGVRDFVASGDLDRSFEIQNIAIDWMTGEVGLKLFGSSRTPGAIAATADATVLSDAWYSSLGTALSSVVTIAGSNPGHVTAGGTLTGTTDMNAAGSIFYYAGDLVIDPGVTITLVNNVQLRVKGFLQNNGLIEGVGNGIAGASQIVATHRYDYNPGTSGYIGVTEATGGWGSADNMGNNIFISTRGGVVVGSNSTMPSLNLNWDGTTLSGLPSDLRGTSGSSGMPYTIPAMFIPPDGSFNAGSDGGDSGAGLLIVSRGVALGAAGVIDLSGGAGDPGVLVTTIGAQAVSPGYTGSGAGGAPGGLAIILDGSGAIATGLTEAGFVAENGSTPIMPTPLDEPSFLRPLLIAEGTYSSYYVGTGDGTTFLKPSLSGSRGGNRVQYVPGNVAATSDLTSTLAAPTNLGLASGTDQLLVQGDGTVVPRILATWTPSLDSRTLGYELQFKPSTETIWSTAPLISGQSVSAAFIVGIADGVDYDVRVRAVGAARAESDWLEITDYFVIGKTARPSDVTLFTIEGTILSWGHVDDQDVKTGGGYLLKYQPGTSRSWGDAIPLHEGVQKASPYDMVVRPSGPVMIMVKAIDSTGNESQNAAYISTDLGDPFVANIVATFDLKADGFPGTKTNSTISGGDLVADLITPLMWKADDSAAMWDADSSTLLWATVQYAAMTYVDTITVSEALSGSRMTIQHTIQGDPWSIEYRENSPTLAWNADASTLAWNAVATTLAWDQPAYLPWPGEIVVVNSIYQFRIAAGQSTTQGVVSEFTVTIDAPDIEEFVDNVVISSGGTRLPITQVFAVIKNIQLTVQADGGTAISARVDDKVTTLGAGPLIHGLDAAGSNTSALVDAHIQGY